MQRKILCIMALALILQVFSGPVLADPCLIVYPTCSVTYFYDESEYYLVSYGHPLYDSVYDRGGVVLVELNTDEIPLDIYQAPGLSGFEASSSGEDGYFFQGYVFELIIDGWSHDPVTYVNILLVFDPIAAGCEPEISVDGSPVIGPTFSCGDLAVSTPVGPNYSDTIQKTITWQGCFGIRIWAFADENGNGIKDGGECFTAFSHDMTVPTESSSWGAVKSMHK